MKSKLFLILRAAVSIILTAVLIYMLRGSIPNMLTALKHMTPGVFFMAYLIFAFSLSVVSFRLKSLLIAQDISINALNLIRLTYLGYFFSSFLPTSVGGDVVKAFYISRASNKTMQSYTSVVVDRFLGMFTLCLMAAAALFFATKIPELNFKWILPVLPAVSILFIFFLFDKRAADKASSLLKPLIPASLKDKFKRAYDAIRNYRKHKLKILACLLISITAQIIGFCTIYVFGLGLDTQIPLVSILLAMPVASVASMLPSVFGTGPREMAIVLMLAPFAGKEKALAIAFLWLFVLLITALIGGVLYAFTGMHKIKAGDLGKIAGDV